MVDLAAKKISGNKQEAEGAVLAVVRVRGVQGVRWKASEVMRVMGLTRRYSCTLLKNSPSVRGMLARAKDYVTWGAASPETVQALLKKARDGKPPFGLHPPRGGIGSLKRAFPKGALGSRGEAVNQLIGQML